MRQLIYGVAASLDGFISGPNGEYDWILPDSGIDFVALYSKFDTFLMGRRTYEVASSRSDLLRSAGMRNVAVSTTLDPAEHAEITVVKSGVPDAVRALKAEAGKNIWLFGGGILFRYLLDMKLVDAIEVCVFPVLLGAGTPLLPEGSRAALKLKECKALSSGVVMVSYAVLGAQP